MKKLGVPVRVVGVLCAVLAGLASASPAMAAPSTGDSRTTVAASEALPQPVLALTGLSLRTTGGTTFIEASLSVTNYAAYPDAMFAPAPDLPPCGSNTNSSRTWVDIYNGQNDQYVYGFCSLSQAQSLTRLWFARSVTVGMPPSVYVRLQDRRTGVVYKSNSVSIG